MKYILMFCWTFTASLLLAQHIDTKHLLLDLQFDWSQKQAYGRATITLALLDGGDTVRLDAGKLTIKDIVLNGQKVPFNYDGGDSDDNLEIILDRKYPAGEYFTLAIDYRSNHVNQADPNAIGGSFGKGLRFQQPSSTTPNKRKQIWSSGEPNSNRYWFPCNEDIADIHTTEIKATIEAPLMLVANGRLRSIIVHENNTRTYHYKSDGPFPNYLVSIVVGEFANVQQTAKGKTINNLGYPHERKAVKATVELLPDMMRFMEQQTGQAYPYKAYTQVVVQDYPFPGMVGQHTASILSDNYIDDHGVHQDFKYLWDGVALQALANQWFGNLVMPKSWEHIWLNNAFAQYFAGLYTAKDNSEAEYLTYYHPFEQFNVLADWHNGNRHPIVPQQITDLAAFTTDSYSKYRGALVLRMLQKEMGDEQWWKALRYYLKSNAGQTVDTKDFQAAVEKISGQSYQWFFDQWLYKIGLPQFEVSHSYNLEQKQLSIFVKQVQSPENSTDYLQVAYFEGNLDLELGQNLVTVRLKPQAENVFVFKLDNKPSFVNFNVAESFLCEVVYEQNTEEYLSQLKFSRDVLAKQKAIDHLVITAKDSTTSTELKALIIQAIKAEFESKQYWRYRWYALGALQKIFTLPYEPEEIAFLLETIQKERSWIKSTAINMLSKTNDAQYKDIYIKALKDESDRVINAAANALGKTKHPDAFDILMALEQQPSWKNQNRISALNGLQQLGDERALAYILSCLSDNQSPRWYLATPVWDYPFAAVNALVALGKAEQGFPLLFSRFEKSLQEDDLNDIFQNVQLLNLLQDARTAQIYPMLYEKFKSNAATLEAVKQYENQFLSAMNP